ncbi:HAD-IIIC family phosphatase [Alteromonas sp. a30]|uniref:HAD-IIIC family phosphatase n=1 Tax=Alteromonas sp. a30 TaxID=2730917 RepID=UPI002281DEF8|nr:HAD-IIIC family phosphatase [Alteromonas sp. a30]MCY7295205.1 HAD-IIIC family phosphatase [Alteromonas sp. a30]
MTSASENRKNVKCVVWDLDNTLWSGVLVEGDELILKPEIVNIIKALDAQGILQSIASKNNYEDAMDKLRSVGLDEYFLYPQINWNPKSSAIATIREKLNIGIDTFLFIDDQPFERDEVQALHPEVECVDALEYAALLHHPRIVNIKKTDDAAQRRVRYLEDMQRQNDEEDYQGTPEAFLAALDMEFTISSAQPEDLLRAEELTERTNQLNSTGITYDKEELAHFMNSDTHELLVCELKDKYGSYGKIGLALIEIGESSDMIKLLLMSCRTAARGVGSVLLSYLMKQAQSRGHTLQAQFKRTSRNRQMLVTYQFANFKEITRDDEGNILFENDLSLVKDYPDYIKVITQ